MTNNTMAELILTELLNGAYKNLEWTRDNFDLETKIDNYHLTLVSGRDGLAFVIDSIPCSGDRHVVINMEDDKRVQDLYSKIFDFVNQQKQDKFLQGLYEVLRNIQ